MSARKIAVVTGARAEYGLLAPIMHRVRKRRGLRLQLLVTGAHLEPRLGLTVREIERDGFRPDAKVPLRLSGDSGQAVAQAIAGGVSGFARAFARLRPDVAVVLGDRYEILAAATAALPLLIPVAHVHGGESSEGVWDESVRHAVTKLSHLHFPAAPEYARRLIQMGEDPRRVFCFGSPAADRLRELPRLSRQALARDLGLDLDGRPLGVVTYHPATLSADRGAAECAALLRALASVKAMAWIITYPNADAGGAAVLSRLRAFERSRRGAARLVASLGQKRYFSLLAQADVMAGNSSSGLLEAPYFRLPVVNVGDRQRGRLRRGNVIDVPRATPQALARALKRALSPAFRAGLRLPAAAARSPSGRIVDVLAAVELGEALIKKGFHGR